MAATPGAVVTEVPAGALAEASPLPRAAASRRLVSLDAFRGITIAGMILVNNPGSWRHIYGPLRHAEWHGWTPTDLVFPFFLFIVGTAMAFSIDRRRSAGRGNLALLGQIVRRSVILFLLGLIMFAWPDWRLMGPYILAITGTAVALNERPRLWPGGAGWALARRIVGAAVVVGAVAYFVVDFAYFQQQGLRVPGVLQRIAVCYGVAAVIAMLWGVRGRIAAAAVLIVAYWAIVALVPAPGGFAPANVPPDGVLHDWVDVQVLAGHLYRERPDPEGILSTLPAIATVLLGLLAGQWLLSGREARDKVIGLFLAGNVALVLALAWDDVFPINKKIWTSSYVVLTAGLAAHFLAVCYWLIDVRGWRGWAWPFVVFGSNAIVAFLASSLLAKQMGDWRVTTATGEISLKGWLYRDFFESWAGPLNGSLLFAIAYVLLWLVLMTPLYKLRIYIKI